jgi:hypothetical protein
MALCEANGLGNVARKSSASNAPVDVVMAGRCCVTKRQSVISIASRFVRLRAI